METFPGQGFWVGLPFFPDPDELTRAFRELVDGQWLTNRGPRVREFELAVRDRLGGEPLEVVSCSSATSGLEITLRAMGLRGKVITTPLTFAATAHAIVNAGLEPVFADVDAETFCLSPDAVAPLLTPDVCAILPVHVYGEVCDVARFAELGVPVIYDAAHAFGIGGVGHYGAAEVFSFHASKIVNACEGGAVVTRDAVLAERIRRMTCFGFGDDSEVSEVGTNAKLSEVHALFGLHSLAHFDLALARRVAAAQRYRARLADVAGIYLPPATARGQFFPIVLPNERLRDALCTALKTREIFTRRYFFPPLHRMKPYAACARGGLTVAETVAARVLCLPLHPGLASTDVDRICDAISDFLKTAG